MSKALDYGIKITFETSNVDEQELEYDFKAKSFNLSNNSHRALNSHTSQTILIPYRSFGMSRTAIFSEEPKWEPAEGMKWEEKDFEAEIKKLEKEATERLDEKVADMMKNIESTGK